MINNQQIIVAANAPTIAHSYTITGQFVSSASFTFNMGSISSLQRLTFGYAASEVYATEIRVVNFNAQCGSASTCNVQAGVALTHQSANFRQIGTFASYNTITSLTRSQPTASLVMQDLFNPVACAYAVLDPSNYLTSAFVFTMCNLTTGAMISTADIASFQIQITEYVKHD